MVPTKLEIFSVNISDNLSKYYNYCYLAMKPKFKLK